MFIKKKLVGLLFVIVSLLLVRCAKTFDYELTDNAPTIDSIRPERGTENTQVRIYGKNFPKDTASLKAFFNNKQGLIIEQTTANVILATVPYEAGTGNVVIKHGEQTINGPTFTYDYDAPVILDVTPLTGIAGTEITINGRKFSGVAANNKVQINGVEAAISSSSITQLRAVVPEAKNGPITVVANNIANQGPVFRFIPQLSSIDKTSAFAGETVRLTGKYFDVASSKSVTFNGVAATIISGSATTLDVTVPAASSGNIVVNVDGVNSNPLAFTYRIAPTITGLSKTSAYAQDTLTVYGANFSGNAAPTVNFGSAQATVMNYAHNSIKVRVPNGTGTLPVTVSVDNVTSNSVQFSYRQNIVASSLNQTSPVLRNVSGIDAATVVIKGSSFGTDVSSIRVTVGGQTAQVTAVDDGNVTFLTPSYHSSLPNQQQIKVYHQNIEASYPNGNLTFTYLEPTISSASCVIVPFGNGFYQFMFNVSGNHFNSSAPNANFQILIDGVNHGAALSGNNAVITTIQQQSFIKNRYDIWVRNKWGGFILAYQRDVNITDFNFSFVPGGARTVVITGSGFGSTADGNRSIRLYRVVNGQKAYLTTLISTWSDNQVSATFTESYIDDLTYGVEVRVNSRTGTYQKDFNLYPNVG